MALKVCSTKGCPELVEKGRCPSCTAKADKNRGTPAQRGYASKGHRKRFRPGVLAKHPICVVCRKRRATIADHYPHSRKELVRLGLDPDDPAHGRGLCKSCHDVETSIHQPGGWNDQA